MDDRLSVVERRDLRTLERVIDEGVVTFIEVGNALLEIQKRRLHRESGLNFESYVAERFGVNKSNCYRLISASQVKKRLDPLVKDIPEASQFFNESQLIALEDVPQPRFKEVVERTVKLAYDRSCRVTKRLIDQVKAELLVGDTSDSIDGPANVNNSKELPSAAVNLDTVQRRSREQKRETKEKAELAVENAGISTKILYKLNQCLREMKEITEVPGMEVMVNRRNAVIRQLETAKGMILAATPYEICPICKGKGCPKCGNHGWVNNVLYREMKKR